MKSAILGVCCLAVLTSAQWPELEETIWLPDSLSGVIWPAAICYNPVENVMYVGGQAGGTIMVIDAVTYEKRARIPIEQGVLALCFDRARNQLYCSEAGRGTQSTVVVIDGRTNEVRARIEVGPDPGALCIDTVLGKLYCAVERTGDVAVIDCATNQIVANVDVGSVRGLCWNPAMGKVYCANPGHATVSVVDCVNDSVVAVVPTPEGPTVVCYNSVQNKVYCAADSIAVVDCAADTVCGILSVWATALLYCDHRDKLYFLPRWWEEVWVADGEGDSLVSVVPVPGGEPRALATDPGGEKLYCGVRGTLPNGAWVLVVDTRTDSVVDSLHIGGYCDGVSALACGAGPDPAFVLTFTASGWSNGGVVVLDVAGREVLAELTTSRYPRLLSYNSTENLVYVAEPEPVRPTVVVVDAVANQVVDTIPAWPAYGLEYNSRDNKLYVAAVPHLAIFDGATHILLDTLDCLSVTQAVCYNPTASKVYAAGTDREVVIVDGAGDSVRARLTFNRDMKMALCAPDLNKVYVGDSPLGVSSVYALDGKGDSVVAVVSTGSYQRDLCYNPATREIYASCLRSNNVWVIDAEADTVVAVVSVSTPEGPMCYAQCVNRVYCSTFSPEQVAAIDGLSHEVTAWIPTPDLVTRMFYNSINELVYCVSETHGAVYILDPVTNKLVDTIEVGQSADAVAWNPVQNRVYVGNKYNSSLSVIRDSIPAGIAGAMPKVSIEPPGASIIRGVLPLPGKRGAELLDIAGRRVMDLQAGENDVRVVAPGVYFIHARDEGGRLTAEQGIAIRKVVVQR